MEKQMTRRELMAACKAADKQALAERRAKTAALAKAMTSAKFDFFPWELEEVSRLVHGAYGRAMLGK